MSREWQQTKMRKYVMPDAVYHQTLWAVRDLYRMEQRLEELETPDVLENADADGASMVCEESGGILSYGNHIDTEAERALLEQRIGWIHQALEEVPVMYRFYILRNIIFRETGKTYPAEWRMWKQKFLFYVAKNLKLI